ncbi:glycosyltransferase family 4 protein [Desulfospira joergensenii]|uniref:glycosyltransferase family 4 protein n=1 Tax=Desulfospira joergensenii TaxID=53329 RepID=UPI0003B72BBE|nr:glycosyltransferase family 1 protein [Desulfospira joergensenii]
MAGQNTTLKIFYDISFIGDGRISGIERFSLEIYHHLKNSRGMNFFCALPKGFEAINTDVENILLPSTLKSLNHFLHVPWILKKIAPDVALFPAFPPAPYVALFRGVKIFRVLHDIVYWQRPETLSENAVWYLKPLEKFWLSRYQNLFTVSNYSKNKIVEALGFPEEKIWVVPNGVSDTFQKMHPTRHKTEGNYLLCVGTIEPRKNFNFAVDVFDQLVKTRSDLKLFICGRKGWGYKALINRISHSPNASKIRLFHDADDKTLADLYHGCWLFLFPSIEEGFGIPLVEAMAQGKAVIASDNSAISEVVGDAGILISEYDPAHWCKKITQLIDNKPRLKKIKQMAKDRAAQFTWPKAVDRLEDAIHNAQKQNISY